MKDQTTIEDIIVRDLNNESSEQERTILFNWLAENQDHRQEYEELKNIWQNSADMLLAQQFDTQKGWEQVEKKIDIVNSHKGGKVVSMFKYRYMAAAAVIIFVLVGIMFWTHAPIEKNVISIVANESNKEFHFPDGTLVLLRRGSSLSYSPNEKRKIRTVELRGEAYFDIHHINEQLFQVNTSHSVIKDIGTSFLVKNTDSSDEVSVTSGQVKFINRTDTSKNIFLGAGETANLSKLDFTKDSLRTLNYLSWNKKSLIFIKARLTDVIKDLNDYYAANIQLDANLQSKAHLIRLNDQFINQSLDQVLEELQLQTGLKIKHMNNIIVLTAD
ncbi:MAG: FecR domain-containing protein [Flavisolibacter sp.]